VSPETLSVYLGIDPGLRTTGYGVLRFGTGIELLDAGTIRSRASDPLPERLAELHGGLVEVIETFRPEVMGLEEVFSHYRHPSTAISMAHARGVLCLAGAQFGLRVVSLPPATIKKLITGNGRAGKEQVSGMVRHLLGIREPISPSDVTDALAIALAAHESERNDREHPGDRRGR
jgi:crossover junction endodeoxyribonuclease RuvC